MENFDWKTYINNYDDLRKVGINTCVGAWSHWINYGRKEGRTFKNLSLNPHNISNATKNDKKTLVIIACHTNNNIKYNILKNNIKYFEKDNIDIVLINSIECMKNYNYSVSDKIIDNIYVNNNILIDFGKWVYVLENKEYVKNYKNIIFTNDSYIIVNNIDNFLKSVDTNNQDLYGYNDSNEIKYHYQSYLFSIKSDKINILMNLFYDNIHKINSTHGVIFFMEINLVNYFTNKDCYLKIANDTRGKNIFFVCDNIYENLLNEGLLPFIKIKRLYYLDNNKIIIPKFIENSLIHCNFIL